MPIPMTKAAEIAAWEDDPGSDTAATRAAVPDLAKAPLAFVIEGPQAPPPDVYARGTPQFRYWTAAEALRRAADFWEPFTKSWQQGGKPLRVLLDAGIDLNAFYTRDALVFCRGPGQEGIVWAGESPDIVCHELGHAILDSIKPDLWDATSHEAAAFHESFGDISAILSALQLPSVRAAVRAETGGQLYRNSRLSRLGEQIGTAVRMLHPDAVEPDCLRNAVNSFTYVNPLTLPQMAPSSMLSSEPHSFSRIFTGAFFEILAGVVTAKMSKTKERPTYDKALLDASAETARILIDGIGAAVVVPNFYSEVAAAMVDASAKIDPCYPAILKLAFVRRSILSLQTAAQDADPNKAQFASKAAAGEPRGASPPPTTRLPSLSIAPHHYGLDRPLLVHAASHQRPFVAALVNVIKPSSSPRAATSAFVNDLFRLGRVNDSEFRVPGRGLDRGNRASSHELVAEPGGARLKRCRFACGMAH
jgi:hypothetical protein